jgi:glucosamine--fructose-6-phosphate aminotransferase (isomerizing)
VCGIVGYTGSERALPALLEGMAKLEYRGYDSAGVAVVERGRVRIVRRAGKLDALVGALDGHDFDGRMGIGHTRWATHGAPTDGNAHPHRDCTGKIAVVHNGIIENHDILRERLSEDGHEFTSDTDTEVVAHLLEALSADGRPLRATVQKAVGMLEGAFALVCIHAGEPDTIVVARQEPPLIVGAAPGVGLVASDIPALLAHTRDVVPLGNHELAEVKPGKVRLFGFDGSERPPETVHVEWDLEAAQRAGFDDFMLKEIFEQPVAVRNTLRGRVAEEAARVELDEVRWSEDVLRRVTKIVIVACGTSYHAGMAAKHALEHWTRVPVELDLASEFRYRDPVLDDTCLVIGIAQSGETADTLAAVRFAKQMGATVVAVTNVVGSSITRDADAVLFTRAGPEIGVAATKTFLTQLVALNLLALYLAQHRGTMAAYKLADTLVALQDLPDQIEEVLALQGEIRRAAKRYADARDFLFIGRGVGMAVAMEGALKLKEISYIHAEGYAAGELKHGAIALIEAGVPVVAILTGARLYEKMLANVSEVRARGADTILVAPRGDARARALANELFEVPVTKPLLTPVLDTVCLQLLAYFVAKEKGLSPDKPRNLAKSVTVE